MSCPRTLNGAGSRTQGRADTRIAGIREDGADGQPLEPRVCELVLADVKADAFQHGYLLGRQQRSSRRIAVRVRHRVSPFRFLALALGILVVVAYLISLCTT
jgi:hypothetical protein